MTERGATTPSEDPDVRAAFLLANDLALVLLRPQITSALGVDPLSTQGLQRWAGEASAVYVHGAFAFPDQPEEASP